MTGNDNHGESLTTSCSDCGGLVSKRAITCPHCGAPLSVPVPGNAPGHPVNQVNVATLSPLPVTFVSVWYRPNENRGRNYGILAMRDIGTLEVMENLIRFNGRKEQVLVQNIQRISYGNQGWDWVNPWVKIEYQDGETAFFADGRILGWSGIFGGTRQILTAVNRFEPY